MDNSRDRDDVEAHRRAAESLRRPDIESWSQLNDRLTGQADPDTVALFNERAALGAFREPPSVAESGLVSDWAMRIPKEDVPWIWQDWLPKGRTSFVSGRPGDGKTTMMLDLVARLSAHDEMPDGTRNGGPYRLGIVSTEDEAGDTIVPRLEIAGADLERVAVFLAFRDPETFLEQSFTIPKHLAELEAWITRHGLAAVLLDPLGGILDPDTDAYREITARSVMLQLRHVARHTGCSLCVIRHPRKGAGNPLDMGNGSMGFGAAVRVESWVWRDPRDPDRITRVLTPLKRNISLEPPSLAFHFERDVFSSHPKVIWDGRSDLTYDDLEEHLSNPGKVAMKRGRKDERDQVVDWLVTYLIEHGDTEPSVLADGSPWHLNTLKKYRKDADVVTRQDGQNHWLWSYRP